MGIKHKDLIIGRNVYELLPEICERYNLKDIGFFSGDSFTYEIAKNKIPLKELAPYLSKNFKNIIKIPEASMDYVNMIRRIVKENGIKVAVVIGGGSPCDTIKLASYQENIEFIYLPTTLSHDGINSNRASIKGKYPYSEKAKAPFLVIVDLDVVESSPIKNIRAGFGDGFAKCVSLSDWKLDCDVNKERCELKYDKKIEEGVAGCFKDLIDLAKFSSQKNVPLNDEKVLKRLILDLYKFGGYMQIAESSRPCSGSEHLFSHALDVLAPKPALHGEQVAVGTIACTAIYNEELDINPYGISWGELKDISKSIGLPVNSSELCIASTYLVNALGKHAKKIGRKRKRFTIIEHVNIDKRKAEKYLKLASII